MHTSRPKLGRTGVVLGSALLSLAPAGWALQSRMLHQQLTHLLLFGSAGHFDD